MNILSAATFEFSPTNLSNITEFYATLKIKLFNLTLPMQPKIGVDLVDVSHFQLSIERGGERFLKKIFTESELDNSRVEHLAGLFAAKEAITKALSISPGSWQKICITKEKSGRPEVKIESFKGSKYDLSISHDGNFAMAVFIWLG